MNSGIREFGDLGIGFSLDTGFWILDAGSSILDAGYFILIIELCIRTKSAIALPVCNQKTFRGPSFTHILTFFKN